MTYTPNLEGAITEFSSAGAFVKTFVSSSQFAITGPGMSGFSPSQLTLNLGNRTPTASAGTSHTISEGSSLTLHAVASDPDHDALTYSWDINGDGTFGDTTGASPTLTWAQLQALGVDYQGTFNISVMVNDGHGHVVTSVPVTLTMNYKPPTVQPMVAASYFDNAIYEFNPVTGGLLDTLVPPNSSQTVLSGPAGVTVGPDGNLYISSQNNNSIVEFNISTQTLSTFINSAVVGIVAPNPAGLLFGPDGDLYVASSGGGSVVRFDITSASGQLSYASANATIVGGLAEPTEITFGAAANDLDSLYVSNSAGIPCQDRPRHGGIPDEQHLHRSRDGRAGRQRHELPVRPDLAQRQAVRGGPGRHLGLRPGAPLQRRRHLRQGVCHKNASARNIPLGRGVQFRGRFADCPSGAELPAEPGRIDHRIQLGRGVRDHDGEQHAVRHHRAGYVRVLAFAVDARPGQSHPTVSAGGSYTINQGGSLTLRRWPAIRTTTLSRSPGTSTATAPFGDATGVDPTLTWAQLQALGITGPGTFNVRVMASDGHGHVVTSAVVTLTVK